MQVSSDSFLNWRKLDFTSDAREWLNETMYVVPISHAAKLWQAVLGQ